MLILHYIEWLPCKRDVNVNTTDFDVEYEESEAIFFHWALFIWMDRRQRMLKWNFWLLKIDRKHENSILTNQNSAQWTVLGRRDSMNPKVLLMAVDQHMSPGFSYEKNFHQIKPHFVSCWEFRLVYENSCFMMKIRGFGILFVLRFYGPVNS